MQHTSTIIFAVLVSFIPSFVFSSPEKLEDMSYAEKAKQAYKHLELKTFYCACDFNSKLEVNVKGCDYTTHEKYKKRVKRVEWEHVVPASVFGKQLPSWKRGHKLCVDKKGKSFKGRSCAKKVNKQFLEMESDIFNVVPAVGQVNALRSNFGIGKVFKLKSDFGACESRLNDEKKLFEPADEVKGDVARIYMYMETVYPGFDIINDKNIHFIMIWDQLDPVSVNECLRYRASKKVEKRINPILEKACSDKAN